MSVNKPGRLTRTREKAINKKGAIPNDARVLLQADQTPFVQFMEIFFRRRRSDKAGM